MSMTHNVDELNALRLTADDIESQTGFTTHRFWVGSLLGGVYRPSVWHQPQYWLALLHESSKGYKNSPARYP